METEATPSTVNSIIAQALQNVGVPEQNINLPAVPAQEPTEAVETSVPDPYAPEGTSKGEVVGSKLETPKKGVTGIGTPPAQAQSAEPVAQPLAKTDIEEAINQATSKFQSIMDKKINLLNTQMQGTIGALNKFFETQETTSLAGLSPEEQTQKRLERLEQGGAQTKIQIPVAQPAEQQSVVNVQQLVNFLDTVGLKVEDKRIDWAPDTDNPTMGFNRFLVSVKTALLADQTKLITDLKDTGTKELQKLRKKTGVDDVSTLGPGGSGLPDLSKMTAMQKIEFGIQQQAILNLASQ